MAFCKNCGQELKEGVQFCANCGTPVDAQPQQAKQVQTEQVRTEQLQAEPVTAVPVDDVAANRGIAWLAYFGLLFLVPMFARKNSEYCEFHVRQGVVVCAACIAYAVTVNILLLIVGAIFLGGSFLGYTYHSGVYNFFNVIFSLGYIFFTVFEIIGIVNAATGKQTKLPIFGSINILDPLMDKIYNK